MQTNEGQNKKIKKTKFVFSNNTNKLTFKVRKKLFDRIEAYCERNGLKRTDLCVQATRSLLNELKVQKDYDTTELMYQNGTEYYKRICFRCPKDLYDEITKYCYTNHIPKTRLLTRATEIFLDKIERKKK
ncbi:MAG: hypothetical protein IJA15_06645 [Clostridia bacterium]|nr:hypothetical protein [Clostridia bacterium]